MLIGILNSFIVLGKMKMEDVVRDAIESFHREAETHQGKPIDIKYRLKGRVSGIVTQIAFGRKLDLGVDKIDVTVFDEYIAAFNKTRNVTFVRVSN